MKLDPNTILIAVMLTLLLAPTIMGFILIARRVNREADKSKRNK